MVSYEHKVKNIYLGGPHRERMPGPNTIAYYKFDGNLNDSSGNNKNLTATSTPTYGTNYINLSNTNCLSCSNFDNFTHDRTVNVYANLNGWGTGDAEHIFSVGPGDYISSKAYKTIYLGVYNGVEYTAQGALQYALYSDNKTTIGGLITLNSRYNIVYTYNYTNKKAIAYVNGNKVLDVTFATQYTLGNSNFCIGCNNMNNPEKYGVKGALSEYIVESRVRTAEEISDYFNGTKSKYGIS